MKGSWVARLKTALLTAVVLSGGGGMPLLDLALYHGLAPDRSAAPHFESRTPHGHGDTCRLSSSLSHCPRVEPLDLDIPSASSSDTPPPVAISAPRLAHPGLPPARAPPAHSALPLPQLT
jgi:hypothetical protein